MLRAELHAALVGIEVGGERLDRAVVDGELAVRVAAGRDEQQRAAPGAVQVASSISTDCPAI